MGQPGEDGSTCFKLAVEKGFQAKTEPAGCAGASDGGDILALLTSDYLSQAAQINLGLSKILVAKAFLAAVDATCAQGPEKGVLHVDGDDGFRWWCGGQGSWFDTLQTVQIHPLREFHAFCVKKTPANGASHAEATIVSGASTDAHEYTLRPAGYYIAPNSSESVGIQLKGVEFARGQESQAVDLRGFDDGCFGLSLPVPSRLPRAASGISGIGGTTLGT